MTEVMVRVKPNGSEVRETDERTEEDDDDEQKEERHSGDVSLY